MNEKIRVEVKQINKNSKEIEWSKTLEIPYEKINNEVETLKEELNSSPLTNENSNTSLNNNKETNDIFLKHDNPFYQPNMNTIEFDKNDTLIIADIIKPNNEKVEHVDELRALEKLLENEIISEIEFMEKKRKITK